MNLHIHFLSADLMLTLPLTPFCQSSLNIKEMFKEKKLVPAQERQQMHRLSILHPFPPVPWE